MDSKSLGGKLRSYRAKCGWSLQQCAEKSGISVRYLSDIERGDRVPKLETFISILNVLNASADDVLQDSLAIGYQLRSNQMLAMLDELDADKRQYALDILEGLIHFMR